MELEAKKEQFNMKSYIDLLIKEHNKIFAYRCANFLQSQEGYIKNSFSINNKEDVEYLINDDLLNRLRVAREGIEDKAFIMYENWIKWRVSFKPDKITLEEISKDLKAGKSFIHGYDIEGRPCIIIKPSKHFPKETTFENSIKLAVFWLEKLCKIADNCPSKKIIVIVDQADAGWSNIDYSSVGKGGVFTILQDYYAERVHKIIVINVSFLLKAVMKFAMTFMTARTKQKLCILNDNSELLKFISKDQLLIEHGGSSKYIYESPIN